MKINKLLESKKDEFIWDSWGNGKYRVVYKNAECDVYSDFRQKGRYVLDRVDGKRVGAGKLTKSEIKQKIKEIVDGVSISEDGLNESKKLYESTGNFYYENRCVYVSDEDFESGNVPETEGNDIGSQSYPSYALADYNDGLQCHRIVLTSGYYEGACIDFIEIDNYDALEEYRYVCENECDQLWYNEETDMWTLNGGWGKEDKDLTIDEAIKFIQSCLVDYPMITADDIRKALQEEKDDGYYRISVFLQDGNLEEKIVNQIANNEIDKCNQIIDQIKADYGYRELTTTARFSNGETMYNFIESKNKQKTNSIKEGYEFNPNRADISWRPYDNEKGQVMADRWYERQYPDDKIGIEQLRGITFDDALKDRHILGHCDTQVRERVYAQLDKYIPLGERLDEASYGGAFDIADDQYFTREDLNDFAEEVLNHINETFVTQFDISACYIDDGVLELEITNSEYGDYDWSEKIDMRKIKEPWHLKRTYASWFASQLINEITQSNNGLIESKAKELKEELWDNRTGVIKRIDKYLSTNPEAVPPKGYIAKRTRAYDDMAIRYGDYVTTPFGNISTDDLMQYAKDNKLLNESSLSVADLKAYYATATGIDKEKYPNFFAWYDEMVKSGKFKLGEDLEVGYEDESIMQGPQEGPEFGIASLITNAIQNTWSNVQMYNELAVTARAEGFNDIADIIDEINTNESKHIGHLQSALKIVSPNAEAIELGNEEGSEILSNPIK